MKNILSLIILSVFCITMSASKKTDADELYRKEKYEQAAKLYEDILKNEGVAPEVYYNLGNCYYKLENIPYAILNYERAAILSPGDNDIRNNLVLARSKTVDKATPASEMFFVTWWKALVGSMSVNGWITISIIAFILMCGGLLCYFFVDVVAVRKIGVYGSLVMLVLVLFGNIAAHSQNGLIENRNTAIVISPAISVKSSPSEGSTDLFVIHEGSKVYILDSEMKGWCEVKFEEGKQGWVPKNSIELI